MSQLTTNRISVSELSGRSCNIAIQWEHTFLPLPKDWINLVGISIYHLASEDTPLSKLLKKICAGKLSNNRTLFLYVVIPNPLIKNYWVQAKRRLSHPLDYPLVCKRHDGKRNYFESLQRFKQRNPFLDEANFNFENPLPTPQGGKHAIKRIV